MKESKLLIPPPVYFFISLFAVILLGMYADSFNLILSPFNLIGILIFILGFLFGGSAAMLFKKNKTTLNPNQASSKLVISGPFKFSRNPMYLGMFLMLLGISIYFGNLGSILISIIFFLMIKIVVITFEEKKMSEKFGSQFDNYKLKVRRWI